MVKKYQIAHSGLVEVDNDDHLEGRVLGGRRGPTEVGQVPPRDFPAEPDIVFEGIEIAVFGALDMLEVQDGARATEAVVQVGVEEEERFREVEGRDRGRRELEQAGRESPLAGGVQEFEGCGGREAGAPAEAEHGDCSEKEPRSVGRLWCRGWAAYRYL